MGSKPKARRQSGSIGRRQGWIIFAASVFAVYCMIMLKMWVWSAASRVDLRANIVGVERAPGSSITQVKEPIRAVQSTPQVVTNEDEPQNLRVMNSPVSASDALESSTFKVETTQTPASTEALTVPLVSTAETKSASLLADRHDSVYGYAAAMKYLANYTIPEDSDEQLFLFFVCGDQNGKETTWRRVCVDASTLVYDVFSKSLARNRLVTIYAGSKADWSQPNAFYNDADLKVKAIPALMQWHGGRPGAKRATSGMIIEESMLYEPLLRYLFKNEDFQDPLLAPEKIASKEIVLLKGYKNYRQYIDTIASGEKSSLTVPDGPMYFYFVAGRLSRNDRPWCPYCRYSDISVEYSFYAFAPPGSRLVKVETVDSYSTWKDPQNEWRRDTTVMVRGVPWMFRAHLDREVRSFRFDRISARFNYPQELFQSF